LKNKKSIALGASILLILAMVITACTETPAAPPVSSPTATQQSTVATTTPKAATPSPTSTTVEVEKKYNVLNPTGIFKPVQTQGLAPRLDTLDGKTIWVNGGEADPVIWPALIERLRKDYTKTTFVYIVVSTYGPSTPEDEVLGKVEGKKKADAVIRGNGW
jgi:hypothetical protein